MEDCLVEKLSSILSVSSVNAHGKRQGEMREKFRKLLLLLVASAVSVLPIHFAQAAGTHGVTLFGDAVTHDAGIGDCDHNKSPNNAVGCDNHPSAATSTDDCCGDNCAGAQMLFTQSFSFQFVTTTDFELVWSQQLPDPIASAEYRPPIVQRLI